MSHLYSSKVCTMDELLRQVELHGYTVIFLSLFFGIVGIPAPEESLLFLVGMLICYGQLQLLLTILSSMIGVFSGMVVAYVLGRKVGEPILSRFGKYIGLNEENWARVSRGYSKNAFRTIVFGLYVPGLRQLSPYFAGMVKVPFLKYCFYAACGTILWTIPFILGGYYLGTAFHINPKYTPYIGIISFVLFIVYVLWRKGKAGRNKRRAN